METLLQLLATVNDEKPLTHFVHCGDLLDAQAASVHDSTDHPGHTLLDEYHEAAKVLKEIRLVLPRDCKLVWCLGNHDDNIKQRNPKRIPADLRDLVDWNKVPHVSDEFRAWKQLPYRNNRDCLYEVGPLIFYHGFSCGANSDQNEGIQMAMLAGGYAHRLLVRGHTHRPLDITQVRKSTRIKLPWHVCNVGNTAFDEMPMYMERKSTADWGRGCVVAEAALTGWKEGRSWDAVLYDLD